MGRDTTKGSSQPDSRLFGVSEFLTGAMNRGGKVRDTRRVGTAQQREVNEP